MVRNKEIIIYLDDYIYLGNGLYESIYIDFWDDEDLFSFMDILDFPSNTDDTHLKSYIEIKNYLSHRRLSRNAHYSLNISLLKEYRNELINNNYYNQDLAFIGWTIDFQYLPHFEESLFLPHTPLNWELLDLFKEMSVPFNELPTFNISKKIEVKVNNVGQANWNEICEDEGAVMVYDIGAPLYSTKNEVRHYISTYSTQYRQSNPVLVISHWDMDHYSCLCYLTDMEIMDLFGKGGVIFPDKMNSLTSKKVACRLFCVLKRKCWMIMNKICVYKSPFPPMSLLLSNNCMSLYAPMVYRSNKRHSINVLSLVVFVQGNDNNVLLTGDCLLSQADDVLKKVRIRKRQGHYLVVPHHGGFYKGKGKMAYSIPSNMKGKEMIISVGLNNRYKHPSNQTISLLSGMFPSFCSTDNNGTVIKQL